MARKYRVVLVDNYDGLRIALKAVLLDSGSFEVIGEACDGADLLDLLQKGAEPDAIVLDLVMPVMTGLEALDAIRQLHCSAKVLVLTMHKEQELLCRSFKSGANGYMVKDDIAKELIPALHAVLEGKIYLSASIMNELIDICQIKSFAGRVLPPEFIHCK